MKVTPLSKEEVHELLEKEKICWLATVTPKRRPHLIPINFGFFNDKVHVIFVDSNSKSVKNMKSNPNVGFGINVGEEASKIRCVLIHGRANLTNDIDSLQKAHTKTLPKYLRSKTEVEGFLKKITASGAMAKRTLLVIKPRKIISWKL